MEGYDRNLNSDELTYVTTSPVQKTLSLPRNQKKTVFDCNLACSITVKTTSFCEHDSRKIYQFSDTQQLQ
jgi:hypothetical protein